MLEAKRDHSELENMEITKGRRLGQGPNSQLSTVQKLVVCGMVI